jgi:hypothetical protein
MDNPMAFMLVMSIAVMCISSLFLITNSTWAMRIFNAGLLVLMCWFVLALVIGALSMI